MLKIYKIILKIIFLPHKFQRLNSWIASFKFKNSGKGLHLGKYNKFLGAKNISIGNNFFAHDRLRIEAIESFGGKKYSPVIKIGNNVQMNFDCHIGAINFVELGDNVMIASRVFISDHYHGGTTKNDLLEIPARRILVSKGPVVIEDSVLIGEGVSILSNVRIGRCSVIGSNTVVTKNIPPFSIVTGTAGKVIKTLDS